MSSADEQNVILQNGKEASDCTTLTAESPEKSNVGNAAVGKTDYVSDGKNSVPIVCKDCGSKILSIGISEYHYEEVHIPIVESKETILESITEFWRVKPLLAFDNIGLSKPSPEGKRYLTCSDCERGPLGYYDNASDTAYLAITRVKHLTET